MVTLHDTKFKKYCILCVIALLLASWTAGAQEQNYTPQPSVKQGLAIKALYDLFTANSADPNSIVDAKDPQLGTSGIYTASPETYIQLRVDSGMAPYTYARTHVKVRIWPYMANGTLGTSSDYTLEVEYVPNQNSTNFVDRAYHQVTQRYGMKYQVIEAYTVNTTNQVSTINDNVFLEAGFKCTRYYPLSQTAPSPTSAILNDTNELSQSVPVAAQISWLPVDGATEYELEWTWVDDYGTPTTFNAAGAPNFVAMNEAAIPFSDADFNLNNTRVQTAGTSYEIPLIYSHGYLIYRIRAIGYYFNSTYWPGKYFGAWSDTGAKTTVSNWTGKLQIPEHQSSMNWQFSASYAEQGKKKDVVSYFDGTLRNRQTVTVVNTEKVPVVGETIYDNQGRGAIEVLPTPISAHHYARYFALLNRNSQNMPYSHLDFDWNAKSGTAVECAIATPGMSDASGASRYYSANNDFTGWTNIDYLPKSFNYPFSQTEYTPDATGRILRKGGLGSTFQLGSNHEMRYAYPNPNQPELNRLFGYQVGNVNHYKKTVVTDPNGQVSVSYVDPKGHTVATALAGSAPDSLDPLYDNLNGDHGPVTEDLLHNNGNVDSPLDNNFLGSNGNLGPFNDRLFYSGTVNVIDNNVSHIFQYTVNNPDFFSPDRCFEKYAFVYKLNMRFLDECQVARFNFADVRIGTEAHTTGSPGVISNFALPFANPYLLNKGNYGLTKDLVVDDAVLNRYADHYIESIRLQNSGQGCYLAPANFAPTDVTGNCTPPTCEQCTAALPAKQSFIQTELQEEMLDYAVTVSLSGSAIQVTLSPTPATPDVQTTANAHAASYAAEWEQRKTECGQLCGTASNYSTSCQVDERSLLSDVSPSGQYGNTTVHPVDANDSTTGITDILSLYNETSGILFSGGTTANHNWRHPLTPYSDEAGVESLIEVQNIGTGTNIVYSPEIAAGVAPQPVTPGVWPKYIKPQELKNVGDFLNVYWKPSWAQSLLGYHPEFCYLQYSRELCRITKPIPSLSNRQMSSDEYDQYLQTINTYADALAAGLVDNTTGITSSFYANDPYFQQLASGFEDAATFALRKGVMEEAINTEYEDHNVKMSVDAYRMSVCNSIDPCTATSFSLSDLNTVDLRDSFWTNYKSIYISLKSKIRYVFLNLYAKQNGCYNGCIGSEATPQTITNVISKYTGANAIKNLFNGVSSSVVQLCSATNALNYKDKEKRFTPVDNMYNSGVSDADAMAELVAQNDYEAYVQTGNCPLLIDLDAYIKGFFQHLPSGYPSSSMPLGRYMTPDLFKSMTGLTLPLATAGTLLTSFNPDNKTLIFNYNGSSANPLKITLPADPNITWANYGTYWFLKNTKQIYFDEANSSLTNSSNLVFAFKMIFVVTVSGSTTEKEIVVSGTTKAKIGKCGLSNNGIGEVLVATSATGSVSGSMESCDKKANFTQTVVGLLNALHTNGQLIANNVQLSNYPQYTQTSLAAFLEEPSGTTTALWTSTQSYCTIIRNGLTKLSFTFNSALPTSFNAFEGMWIDSTPGANSFRLYYTTNDATLAYVSGSFKIPVNFSCCAPSNEIVPYFGLRKSVNLPGDGWTYEERYFEPIGVSVPIGSIADLDISVTKKAGTSFGSNAADYAVTYKLNGVSYPLNFSVPTNLPQPRKHRHVESMLSNHNYYGAAFQLANFYYSVNGTPREFNFEGTSPQTSIAGTPQINMGYDTGEPVQQQLYYTLFSQNPDDHALVLDGKVGLKEAIWAETDNAYKFDFSDTAAATINFKAKLKFTAQLPYYEAPSGTTPAYYFGHLLQIDSAPAGSAENDPLYQFLVFAENQTAEMCSTCIPQTVAPLACSEWYTQYVAYLNFVNGHSTTIANIESTDLPSQEEFCAKNLQYLVASYQTYNAQFGVNSTEHPRYLTLIQFGDTNLNYGYNGINNAISAYANYLATPLVNTDVDADDEPLQHFGWHDYINNIFMANISGSGSCPPAPMQPVVTIVPQTSSDACSQMVESVVSTYQDDSYEAYLNTLRDKFKRDYIQQAMEKVRENFTMQHADKEYQYTLYYYDQAGNLMRTIAPKGVQRMAPTTSNDVDTFRQGFHSATPDPEQDNLVPHHTFQTEYQYNSLNQLVWQKTPDGGESRFAYDRLGRIIASQNAVQYAANNAMAYTVYNALGQIIESGEINFTAGQYTISPEGRLMKSGLASPEDVFTSFTSKKQVVRTFYDDYVELYPPGGNYLNGQYSSEFMTTSTRSLNMRSRVSGILYYKVYNGTNEDFDNGIFYNYDPHGNVKEMVNYYPSLRSDDGCSKVVNGALVMIPCEYHLKRVVYDYDLISGNVKQVTYQPSRSEDPKNKDLFIHKYEYDADNRIVNVQTSRDGVLWEKDAAYQYYPHGPLARTVIGNKKVQGMDYAYTLQGWLKAVNGENVSSPANDMGHDGPSNLVNKDAFGFSLSYFDAASGGNGDYNAIHNDNGTNAFTILKHSRDAAVQPNSKNLYNGNIKKMVTSMRTQGETMLPTSVNKYSYDQLNRITGMNSSTISAANTVSNGFSSGYTFDNNGNIKTMTRTLSNGTVMDNFTYQYADNDNKLKLLNDQALASASTDDIDDQAAALGVTYNVANPATHNYIYNAIGQLAEDRTQGLHIYWRLDGKVDKITNSLKNTEITFEYDGLGNRISKIVANATTHADISRTLYSRDAQGNVLAVYDVAKNASTTTVKLEENHIYGSSRLGLETANIQVSSAATGNTLRQSQTKAKGFQKPDDAALSANSSGKLTALSSLPAVPTEPLKRYSLHVTGSTSVLWNHPETTTLDGIFSDYSLDTKFKTDAGISGNVEIPIGKVVYNDVISQNFTYPESNAILSPGKQFSVFANFDATLMWQTYFPKLTATDAAWGRVAPAYGLNGSGSVGFDLNTLYTAAVNVGISLVDDNDANTMDYRIETSSGNIRCYSGNTLVAGPIAYATNDRVEIRKVDSSTSSAITFVKISGSVTTVLNQTPVTGPAGAMLTEFYMAAAATTSRLYNFVITNNGVSTNQVGHTFTQFGTAYDQLPTIADVVSTNTPFPDSFTNNNTTTVRATVTNTTVLPGDGYVEAVGYYYAASDRRADIGFRFTNTNLAPNYGAALYLSNNKKVFVFSTMQINGAPVLVSNSAGLLFNEGDRIRIERKNGFMYYKRVDATGRAFIYHAIELTAAQATSPLYVVASMNPGSTLSGLKIVNYIPANETRSKLTGMQLYAVKNGSNYSPKVVAFNEKWAFNDRQYKKSTFTYTTSASIPQSVMSNVGMQLAFSKTAAAAGQFTINGTTSTATLASTTASNTTASSAQSQIGPAAFDICWFNYKFGTGTSQVQTSFDFGSSSTASPIESTETNDTAAIAAAPVVKILGPCLVDSDQDGIFDIHEDVNNDGNLANDDTDGDGTPNYLDNDDDGDTVLTIYEGADTDGDHNPNTGTLLDTDGNGIPDYLDSNDDGDQFPTAAEVNNDDGDFNPNTGISPDSDGDGIPDYLDAVDNTFTPPGVSTLADFYNIAGDKRYELANHLGNVLVVINDKKIWSGTTGSFNSDIVSYNDYDPFGMLLGDRKGVNGVGYRFGFQGQERDDEIKGEGNSLNYTFRMHDPRVGRFFAVDPLAGKYPWYSPYQFSGNRTIDKIELEGLETSQIPLPGNPRAGDKMSHTDSSGVVWNYTSNGDGWQGAGTAGSALLDDVFVEGKSKEGFYGGPFDGYSDENHLVGSGAKVGFKFGNDDIHFNGKLKVFNINAYNESTPSAYDVGIEVSGVEAELEGAIGYKKWIGAQGKLSGSAFKAFANAKNGFMTGESGIYGYKQGMNLGGHALEGTAQGGIDILGLTIGGTLSATAGSAHAGYDFNAFLDTHKRNINISTGGNLGWIFGFKGDVGLKFDYGIYEDLFK